MVSDLENVITHIWMESLSYAYNFARGERKNEIEGRHVKRWDERGLHPESVAWGAIFACESLVAALGDEHVATTARALREAARADAWQEHLEALGATA